MPMQDRLGYSLTQHTHTMIICDQNEIFGLLTILIRALYYMYKALIMRHIIYIIYYVSHFI